MKAEISKFGLLILTPESNTESYALMRWHNEASILQMPDLTYKEHVWFKGSFIKVNEDIENDKTNKN